MTSLKNDQKMTGDKKVKVTKNQFLYARQPRKGIFEIHSQRYCNFITFSPGLLMAASIPVVENLS